MPDQESNFKTRKGLPACFTALLAILCASAASAGTVNVSVVGSEGTVLDDIRWILEEDVTYNIDPSMAPSNDQHDTTAASYQLHKSYMPIVASGTGDDLPIQGLDESKRYYLSVIPHGATSECGAGGGPGCFSMSGAPVRFTPADAGTVSVEVVVQPQPIPVAQARILVFEDNAIINNAPDGGERGLGNFTVFIYDAGGGPLVTNAFGEPLDSVYDPETGDRLRLGDGTLRTLTETEAADPALNPLGLNAGEVLIQNLVPGKYGVRAVGPAGEEWFQTSTVEGTPGIDVWIRARESRNATENGPAVAHAFFGMVHAFDNLPDLGAPGVTRHDVEGTVTNLRIPRPADPNLIGGEQELENCWVGLNDDVAAESYFAGPCTDGGASFLIPGVPVGTYGLVIWDRYLLNIVSFFNVTVAEDGVTITGNNELLTEPGSLAVPRWFGTQEHFVFDDLNENGIRDGSEPGLPEQAINLRYRDGSIYAASATDLDGYLPLEEVFPFFSFLVAEVDFARFKATGVRVTVDDGGHIPANEETFADQAEGVRNPQIQAGNSPYRVETIDTCAEVLLADPLLNEADCEEIGAPPLLEAYNQFLGTNFKFEWGKTRYQAGENGGISGVVYNQTTRAENDPRFAAPEPWETGVPRVQVMLYETELDLASGEDVIADRNFSGAIELADVDNYPFDWDPMGDGTGGGMMGPEDFNRNTLGGDACLAGEISPNCTFNSGDAVTYVHTDSWDDSIPEGCVGDTLAAESGFGDLTGRCYDNLRNYSQVRPAVFDGGFGIGAPWDGTENYLPSGVYIVEAAAPPHYRHQDEASKNVDFGDTFVPQALPPICVGDELHTGGAQASNNVPTNLTLFGGVQVDARYTGERPYCNMKVVEVKDQRNAATDFFVYTEVPVSGHIHGNVFNDLAVETDPLSPTFSEKKPARNIPISVRDFNGHEVNRLYTDANGRYNGLVPSTYTINAPMPTGVSPNMVRVCLNDPHMQGSTSLQQNLDPYFDQRFVPICYNFNFNPGQTTYLDTPILPATAFFNTPSWQLDCEYPSGTPIISQVTTDRNGSIDGPVIDVMEDTYLVLTSAGMVSVADPTAAFPATETRDFGFGDDEGTVYIDGTAITQSDVVWADSEIRIDLRDHDGDPELSPGAHQIEVVTNAGVHSVSGASYIAVNSLGEDDENPQVFRVFPGESIQAAIDLAGPGDVVLVAPGSYNESLFITKPIQLQGYGAGVSTIVADSPLNVENWRAEADKRLNCPDDANYPLGLLPGQTNNAVGSGGLCGTHLPGSGLLEWAEGSAVFVAPAANKFGAQPARIDGFTITGANFATGLSVNANAQGLEISNNIVEYNAGIAPGGILIGPADAVQLGGVDAQNHNVSIHHNYVSRNVSQLLDGAGIALYNGADGYRVTSNFVCGNYSQGDGAGITHLGRSPGSLIQNNQVLFNEAYNQTGTAALGGSGAGIALSGLQENGAQALNLTGGTGDVTIADNVIHGNLAGSYDGGGILVRSANGEDLLATNQANWDSVQILNNVITNNVAARAGGGVMIQDSVNVKLVNNTILNNDSTATSASALDGLPRPAGVASHMHSAELAGLAPGIGDFSDPVMANNIIMGNRSMTWDGTGLQFEKTWDLGVMPVVAPGDGSELFTMAVGNTLTETSGVNNPGDNTLAALNDELTLFGSPYSNGPDAVVDPLNFVSDYTTRLPTAVAALDEGGNFIIVTFGPLTLNNSTFGDYKLNGGAFPPAAPVIVSNPPPMQGNAPYEYAVLAVDPNPGTVFSWDVERCNNNFNNCNLGNLFGASISSAGVFTWTPPNNVARNFRITVCDGPALSGFCDSQDITLDPYNSQPPIARDDPNNNPNSRIDVDVVMQPFVIPAPGVLANDSAGGAGNNAIETLSATLADTSTLQADTGGSVYLGSDGEVILQVPNNWVGDTSFTYSVSDGVYAGTSTATVKLRRRVSVTSATYNYNASTETGTLTVEGVSTPLNGHLRVDLLPLLPNGAFGAPVYLGRTQGGNDLQDGTWDIVANNVTINPGDTLQIRRNNSNNVWLTGLVPQSLYNNATVRNGTSAFVQCAGDDNGDGIYQASERTAHPDIACKHLTAGDGFIRTPDGHDLYTFGFSDADGIPPAQAIAEGLLDANFPAPTIELNQGQEFNLTLTNVGTILRPDLFDPHTVHFHGFPNASSVFDGVPESSISINAGFSLTYYYNIVDAGTFMYHCHVEAAEHMQMGMLGNLYVNPAQNGFIESDELASGVNKPFTKFVYNDADGSTGYDVQVPIQIGSMDRNFHDEHLLVQPLPFALMHDDYPMLNGRGYPDTIATTALASPDSKVESGVNSAEESSQKIGSKVTATKGQRILLRISNLNVTQFFTLATNGLPMEVVGKGAHILRGPGDDELYYETNSVTLGGGEAVDVLIDTSEVEPGTYVLYSTNLNELSNGPQDFGGMMTEIVISPSE